MSGNYSETLEVAIEFESLASFEANVNVEPPKFREHIWWKFQLGWKSTLNNLRLLIQPYVFFNLLKPWLLVFEIPNLKFGLWKLIDIMNEFQGYKFVNSE